MSSLDPVGLRIEDQHSLQNILEFSDISGPVILLQQIERILADLHTRPAILAAKDSQKLTGEGGNIFLALAQRWHKEWDHVKPVEKIFPEISFCRFVFKVLVGCGNDAGIYADRRALRPQARSSVRPVRAEPWPES